MFILTSAVETANYAITSSKLGDSSEYAADVVQWTATIAEKCPGTDFDEAFTARSEIENGLIGQGFGGAFGVMLFGKFNH